jgi:single-strand selective monofunctional uracil DNA glycosylase
VAASLENKAVHAAAVLREATRTIRLRTPAYTYNPLEYAWPCHAEYAQRYGGGRKKILFVGMNPGPFGMLQTGVPFGEIDAVRDWLKISGPVSCPERFHPKRPVQGFECPRSEVSGRRLWGLFAERFGTAAKFFKDHFVLNYCPLAFVDEGGRNLTPDKFPVAETAPLFAACDMHLQAVVRAQAPKWVIGVGGFAHQRVVQALEGFDVKTGTILHPSPASPAANRGWKEQASKQLEALGAWPGTAI